jgi:Gas vesicle synthesis protein GvpL/GvpF
VGEIEMETATREGKYIYCVIDSNQPQSFGPLGIGGRGDPLHTICFNDISAVVSDAPMKKYRVSRENSLAHEKAIERVMAEYTALPVRFATIAEDHEKVTSILKREYDKFRAMLDDVRDKTELGLKAIFQQNAIYEDILARYEDIKRLKEKLATCTPERSHYQRVLIGKMVEEALQREKEIIRADILAAVEPLAVEVKINDTYGELMIVNAAFFVERKREAEFDQQIQMLGDKYAGKVTFKYVGSLPPFNFVNIRIDTEDY